MPVILALLRCGLVGMALILSVEAQATPSLPQMTQGPLLQVRLQLARSCNFKGLDGPKYEIACTTIVPMVVTVMSDGDDDYQATVPIMPERRNRLNLKNLARTAAMRLVVDY